MTYRDDRARCPKCGLPEISYCPLWDSRYCANDHAWDGPLNDGTADRQWRDWEKYHDQLDTQKPDE